jgi:hypothetical protein
MRPMMGGVETLGVLGAEGFGVVGLGQDSDILRRRLLLRG